MRGLSFSKFESINQPIDQLINQSMKPNQVHVFMWSSVVRAAEISTTKQMQGTLNDSLNTLQACYDLVFCEYVARGGLKISMCARAQ